MRQHIREILRRDAQAFCRFTLGAALIHEARQHLVRVHNFHVRESVISADSLSMRPQSEVSVGVLPTQHLVVLTFDYGPLVLCLMAAQ